MAIIGQVTAPPGSGKTTSLLNCNPKETVFIDSDRKGMSWAGWRKDYNTDNKNYICTANPDLISKALIKISKERPEVKLVVVDTINSIMSKKEMDETKKKGHDKWMDLAQIIWNIYELALTLREDLTIFFFAHPENYDENGVTKQRTSFNGKKLTKLNIEGKLNYNLYLKVEQDEDKISRKFMTQTDGYNTARSLMGVLPLEMDNDLSEVVKLIRLKDLNIEE